MKPLMRRNQDSKPWGLILMLCLASVAGLLSVLLQAIIFRNLNAASAADVQRAAALTEQLADQQDRQAVEAKAFREDSRLLLLSICDQIEAVAGQTNLEVPPCPRVATNPMSSMPPSPPAAPGASGGTSSPSATR